MRCHPVRERESMDELDVQHAIEPLVGALQADGADVDVARVEGRLVELRLSVEDASCADCVMPGEVLEALLLDAIVTAGHDVERVRLADPRDTDG